MNRLKVGLVSTSQLSFPGNKRKAFQKNAERLSDLAKKWAFDLYVYDKDVIIAEDAYAAVSSLEKEGVDFVLVQTTSFSAGFLAPIFARIKTAKLGLWAIPEGTDSGAMPFNSFCGINMYSGIIGHYLNGHKVHFKWFYGDVDNPLFIYRFCISIRAIRAIKKMQQSHVALIGGIAPGFDDLYDDERNLIRLFDGIRIHRLHEYDEIKKIALSLDGRSVEERAASETAEAMGFTHPAAREMMTVNARFSLAYEAFLKEHGYDAIAISCWPKFQDDFNYSVCAVVGEINDRGTVAACEGDLTSAVSMLLLKYIAQDDTMLMDLAAFDTADDSLLFWHCGPAGKRFCERSGYRMGLNYSGSAHAPDETEVSGTGVVRDMIFDPGKITIARLTGECDRLFLATGTIIGRDKPSFNGSRGWAEKLKINDVPVSALDFVNTVLIQRFQHHFPIVKGDYTKELEEVMAWLDLKKVKIVPYKDSMQNPTEW